MGPTATRTETLRPVHPTAVAILVLALASVARADLTASYDGELQTGRSRAVTVVGALVESNGAVSGSVDVALTDARGGVYRLYGSRQGRRLLLRGATGAGSHLTWRTTVRPASALYGVARIRLRRHTMRGSLVLRARPVTLPSKPPGTCDSAAALETPPSTSTPPTARRATGSARAAST